MTWLLLVDRPQPGPWNMALDQALLEAAETQGLGALRLYGWNPPTLSLGRNEPALSRYDRAAIEARRLPCVRRPTGGRAVWHHQEVTYAVAAPTVRFGSLSETYREIHVMLASALAALGASVRLAEGKAAAGVGAGACFASAAGGEVVADDGGKVIGSAQVRSGRAFLQHGSILLVAEQDVVAAVTRGTTDQPVATGLAELVYPKRATFEAVTAAVISETARRWKTPSTPGELPGGLARRASTLTARYSDDAWTWRR